MRASLSALLALLDEQPAWARFLIFESPVASAAVLERQRRAQLALASALERETQSETLASMWPPFSPLLTAELVVGGVVSVLRARMLEDSEAPLIELEPSLMSFVLASYQRPAVDVKPLGLSSAAHSRESPRGRAPTPVTSPRRSV